MYVNQNECAIECPSGYFKVANGNNVCVSNCSYFKKEGNQLRCYESCSEIGHFQIETKDSKFQCVDWCDSTHPYVINGNTCATECPTKMYEYTKITSLDEGDKSWRYI